MYRLRESRLFMLALAVALGFALWRVAGGVSDTVATLLLDEEKAFKFSEPLTWNVGDRVLTLGQLLRGIIEVAAVGAIAILVTRGDRQEAT
jgi:hypothetical protein